MKRKNLPVFGIGPIFVISCALLTLLGLVLQKRGLLEDGDFSNLKLPAIILGVVLISIGCILWVYAVVIQQISAEIKKGKLVTTGVYSIVRNPIYSAFLLIFTGVLLTVHNLYLLILPLIFYLSLTILMKYTEERWLLEKFGDSYTAYCLRVNRIIPWFKAK
ncbi:MAG: isoprenylcysteine carboxylmethyltransferase family protein [Tissierellia bacterium]|nr:isoprenylcysteine carboxylmethyltransferase family protein [Tissierellia bacterium]